MFVQMLLYAFVGGFLGLVALGHVLVLSALFARPRSGPRGGSRQLRWDVSHGGRRMRTAGAD